MTETCREGRSCCTRRWYCLPPNATGSQSPSLIVLLIDSEATSTSSTASATSFWKSADSGWKRAYIPGPKIPVSL